jgi:MerR family transcriptional regulator, redox-sensitive transcriptional activator SoxR
LTVAWTAGLLTIGELARRTGLRTSARRSYEHLGLLRPATRVGGQRRYHPSAVQQLAVLALLQETGFALAELAELAADPATARARWPTLAQAKLAEVDAQIRQATAAKQLLEDALGCDCPQPGQCELVQAAGSRRAAQQPIRQPRRVAS